MPEMDPNKLFSIAELLEAILLRMDPFTLLISAQRVCRYWHNLIKGSDELQIALFFKPSKKQVAKGQMRTLNPFIVNNLWHGFFRKRLHPYPRARFRSLNSFPLITHEQEDAYLRDEASWKQMLLQQPPTSRIGIIECDGHPTSDEIPLFSQVHVKIHNGFPRLGHLYPLMTEGTFIPGRDTLLLWCEPGRLYEQEWDMKYERRKATSEYLADCDVIFLCGTCNSLLGPPFYRFLNPSISLSCGSTHSTMSRFTRTVTVVLSAMMRKESSWILGARFPIGNKCGNLVYEYP